MGLDLCCACLTGRGVLKSRKAVWLGFVFSLLSHLRDKGASILQFKLGTTALSAVYQEEPGCVSLQPWRRAALCCWGRLAGGVTGLGRELHWEEIMNANEGKVMM